MEKNIMSAPELDINKKESKNVVSPELQIIELKKKLQSATGQEKEDLLNEIVQIRVSKKMPEKPSEN